MLKSRKNFLMNCVLSIAMFFMLFVSLFFYRVQIDNYIFYTFTDFNFKSIFDYCINYGNGRVLGNILCTFLSHVFGYAPLFVSISLTMIVLLVNKLIFNGNYKTVLLVFLTFIIKDICSTEEIYTNLSTFINYVFPFLLFLISICLLLNKSQHKVCQCLFTAVACITAFASTFFSENTAILFLAGLSLIILYKRFFQRTKVQRYVCVLASLVVGTMLLFLIPRVLKTGDKLNWYRGTITFDIKQLILKAAHISEIVVECCPAYLLLSIALTAYLLIVSKKKVCLAHILLLVALPISMIYIRTTVDCSDTFVRFVLLAILVLFATTVIYTVLKFFRKDHLPVGIMTLVILLMDLGMMLIIYPYGLRLFFASFCSIAILFLFLVKWILLEVVDVDKIKCSSKQVTSLLLALSLVFTVVSFLDSVDEFNRHIYPALDEQTQATIDLDNNGIYIFEFVFAYHNRKYAHPKFGDSFFPDFKNLEYFE